MIKLAFITSQRKIIRFEIERKIVRYFDDIWKKGVQLFPKDQNLIERLRRSGNPNLKSLATLIIDANKGKQLEEYQNARNDEEISKIIIKDCKSKGLMEV